MPIRIPSQITVDCKFVHYMKVVPLTPKSSEYIPVGLRWNSSKETRFISSMKMCSMDPSWWPWHPQINNILHIIILKKKIYSWLQRIFPKMCHIVVKKIYWITRLIYVMGRRTDRCVHINTAKKGKATSCHHCYVYRSFYIYRKPSMGKFHT